MAARPLARRSSGANLPAGTPAARPPVRDFTGGAGFTIEWDVRPAYDFIFSLSDDAGSTDDLPSADRRWLTDARASLPQALRASVGRLFGSELGIHLAALLVDRREVRTARETVTALEALGPGDLFRAVFTEAAREPGLAELIEGAIAGDANVLPELAERLPEWRREEALEMLRRPESSAIEIVDVLRAWADRFGTIEERVAEMLTRDYDARAADRATLAGPDLIERTTGGIRWLSETGVRRVILAPSYFSRPYNFLLGGSDWRFFGYPISDDALDAADPLAPPPSSVRLHRALGDETRLRILKLLAGRDLYLTEIAQHLDLSKPTIKHHLALLRSAGLVTITESGTVMYYSLRRQRLDDAATEIKAFLLA
jgi:DNA-binding transcriptional ArsR family regulator